jgi:predicted permease
VFAGVAATSPDNAMWEQADESRPVSIQYATSSYFPVLGLAPSRGTWFSSEQDHPGAGAFAVVSHRTWSSEMGAASGAVGSTIQLNGQPVTILGVGPEDFNGPGGALAIDFWLSISSTIVGGEYRVQNLELRGDHWYDVIARLAPGVPLAQARASMNALALRMGEQNPELDDGRGLTVFAMGDVRFNPEVDGMLYSVGVGVLVVVGLVLLLACSNLANLLLVRGVSRAPEMAVRLALGAGRLRVARLFLLEAFILSSLGAVAGMVLARWAVGLFAYLPLGPGGFGPRPTGMILDVAIDGRVLAFTTMLAVATGLFFGLVPALRAAGVQAACTLREDLRSSAGRKSSMLRNALVGIQVAVSLVLLVGAGLLTRSLTNVRGVDPGVDADQVAVLGVNPSQGGVSNEEASLLMEELRAGAEALPGVTRVALATRLPVQPGGSTTTFVEGYDPPAGTGAVEMPFAFVSPAFFQTLGVGLVTGRTFGPDDRPETPRVVIVNETAARRFWGGEALGKRVRPQGSATAWREVIGVVEDVKVSDLREPPTPMMYYSMEQVQVGCCYVLARAQGDAEALAPSLRRLLQEVRPGLTPTQLGTLESHVGEALAVPRAAAALMGVFSLLALVLATLGIYAVVSFAVARRSAELGIRIALGAARSRLIRMVVAESLTTVGAGILAGLAVALVAAPSLEGVLFQVGASDPSAFVGGAGVILLVALIAAWVPAWRAARADPAGVLRAQ